MTVFIGRVDIATVNSAKQFLSSKSTPIRKNFYVEVLPRQRGIMYNAIICEVTSAFFFAFDNSIVF
jgi:hypothetical protein